MIANKFSFFFFLLILNVASRVYPAEKRSGGGASSINYSFDMGYLWISGLSRIERADKAEFDPHALTQNSNTRGSRTLGLDHLKIALDARLLKESRVHVAFRPDASLPRRSDGTAGIATDSRAGNFYRKKARIELLDHYRLGYNLGNNAEVSLGVFEQLAPAILAYNAILDFGLRVVLPEKYSGVELFWKQDKHENTQSSFDYQFIVYQGREDRSELMESRDKTHDFAQVSKDPFMGAAARISWHIDSNNQMKIMVGYGSEAKGGNKVNELFSELIWGSSWNTTGKRIKFFADVKYNREDWRFSRIGLPSIEQMSLELSTSYKIEDAQEAFVGAHLGRSERHHSSLENKTLVYYGHQIDVGWNYKLGTGLYSQLMISEEHREQINENGEVEDGFGSFDVFQKRLRRLAFGIYYRLDHGL